MDTMIQAYLEETEDMLQKAEDCIIRLEIEYTAVDVNELFRIAHTIKGSSHMVGYEDIGNLMHRIEDMLDCVRNGSILFDQSTVSLCFEGLDAVTKILQCKKESSSQEIMEIHVKAASRISEMVEVLIRVNKKEEAKTVVKQPEMGIISSLLSKESKGKNKYFITFCIEEDAPMVSPVIMIILKTVEDIGTLAYTSVTDEYLAGHSGDTQMNTFDIIMDTDIDESELYTYFALFYVDKINIVNLTRTRLEDNDYYFNNPDDASYMIILKAFMELYNLLFKSPQKLNLTVEDRFKAESLYRETINTFDSIKNHNEISALIKEYNEVYSLILKKHDDHLETNETHCANSQALMVKLIERLYNDIKGKYLFRTFKAEQDGFIYTLRNFIGMVNKSSTLLILIDVSRLNVLHGNEVKDLIDIKKQLENQNIKISMIAEGPGVRKMINIFDSIKPVEEFKVFRSEFAAILDMFQSNSIEMMS